MKSSSYPPTSNGNGYTGWILQINLHTAQCSTLHVAPETLRQFLGGSGLGAKLFFDHYFRDPLDPLSPQNPLLILNGPLTASMYPGTGRFSIVSKSPQTGIVGEGNCGGNFGPELKAAGYDGIIIEGQAPQPVYLYIDNERVELRDASFLWGQDTYAVCEQLKQQLRGSWGEFKILAIGVAGERLVRYAAIINDKGNAIGRCGLGTVMGAKRLKAIAVRGNRKLTPAHPLLFRDIRHKALQKLRISPAIQQLRDQGTGPAIAFGLLRRDVPIKNWSSETTDAKAIAVYNDPITSAKFLVKPKTCFSCPVACKREVHIKEGPYQMPPGPGPEFNSLASFTTLVGNYDLGAAYKANELCNRLGVDTISTASTIAFAIDCYERGLIGSQETKGLVLRWGDMDVILTLIEQIAYREGIGRVLAEGSKRAAQIIGHDAADLSVEVKGLEVPMHDPRAAHGMGLSYAMAGRGACHMQHLTLYAEKGLVQSPEAGLHGNYSEAESREKAEMVVISENLGLPLGSAPICILLMAALTPQDVVDALNAVTDFDYTLSDLLACGERIWYLKRALSNLMGMTRQDDRLPKKILVPTKTGTRGSSVSDLPEMREAYYRLREIDARGWPSRKRLEQIGLSDIAQILYRECAKESLSPESAESCLQLEK